MDESTTAVERVINEYVFGERDRKALKRSIIDRITYERIAEELEISPKTVQNIMRKWRPTVKKHL